MAGTHVCVSRYNASNSGDGGATPKSNIAGVNNAPVGTNCSAGNCCWYGQTAKPCEASSAAECSGYTNCTVKTSGVNGQKYNGCNRMVCGWDAANIIVIIGNQQRMLLEGYQNGQNFRHGQAMLEAAVLCKSM